MPAVARARERASSYSACDRSRWTAPSTPPPRRSPGCCFGFRGLVALGLRQSNLQRTFTHVVRPESHAKVVVAATIWVPISIAENPFSAVPFVPPLHERGEGVRG